jgi:hypothetical protein
MDENFKSEIPNPKLKNKRKICKVSDTTNQPHFVNIKTNNQIITKTTYTELAIVFFSNILYMNGYIKVPLNQLATSIVKGNDTPPDGNDRVSLIGKKKKIALDKSILEILSIENDLRNIISSHDLSVFSIFIGPSSSLPKLEFSLIFPNCDHTEKSSCDDPKDSACRLLVRSLVQFWSNFNIRNFKIQNIFVAFKIKNRNKNLQIPIKFSYKKNYQKVIDGRKKLLSYRFSICTSLASTSSHSLDSQTSEEYEWFVLSRPIKIKF